MDVHYDDAEPGTPGLSYGGASYWRAEDSGYHSFTPGSLECSGLSDSSKLKRKINITSHVDRRSVTPEKNYRSNGKISTSSNILRSCENFVESPVIRRGLKRSYQEDDSENIFSPFPTPTSVIAGTLRELKFNDENILSTSLPFSNRGHSDFVSDLYYRSDHIYTSYPTTPIKKKCRISCKLSSPFNIRKPLKNLNHVMHSLSCETQALLPVVLPVRTEHLPVQSRFYPNQKVDIIKMLYQNDPYQGPLLEKIFSYLSNKDIYNFTLVSPLWSQIWKDVAKKSKQKEYQNFLKDRKANQENKKNIVHIRDENNQIKPLVEIQNVLNNECQDNSPASPLGSPRTITFKKVVESALDTWMQLCPRCCQPAKVTEESSGEEWVACSITTCSYQFCRHCRYERHPGKSCRQYDLNGPSPSKRKKTACVVGSKKSRKNLRRLL